jgi:hypothetical protein
MKPSPYSDEVVRRARLIYARGWSQKETWEHLAEEGHDIPYDTLCKWLTWQTRAAAGGELTIRKIEA